MNFAPFISALANHMGNVARVCTRRNYDQIIDAIDNIAVSHRCTKLVVDDYDRSRLSFTLKAVQIDGECPGMSLPEILKTISAKALVMVSENDTSFKQFPDSRCALKHSGLNSSYLSILRSIETIVRNNTNDGDIIFGASDNFTNPQVLMLFSCADGVILLQFKD